MSKKVSFPVMSLAFTGILFIVGLLVITMKPFVQQAVLGSASWPMINGLLEFVAVFLMLWALTSLSLHPDIEDSNIKLVFAAFTVFIIVSVFTSVFAFSLTLWPPMA